MKSQTTKPEAVTIFNGDGSFQRRKWEIVTSTHKITRNKLVYPDSTLIIYLPSSCYCTSEGIAVPGSPVDHDEYPKGYRIYIILESSFLRIRPFYTE